MSRVKVFPKHIIIICSAKILLASVTLLYRRGQKPSTKHLRLITAPTIGTSNRKLLILLPTHFINLKLILSSRVPANSPRYLFCWTKLIISSEVLQWVREIISITNWEMKTIRHCQILTTNKNNNRLLVSTNPMKTWQHRHLRVKLTKVPFLVVRIPNKTCSKDVLHG